jgi:ParB family transcriptional regulator, chromosome partitioning protein
MATGFKKREVSADRVAAVESATVGVPLIGDVRLPAVEPTAPSQDQPQAAEGPQLGSSQDRSGIRYSVGSIHEVPVGLVKSNPFNPRAVYTSTAVDAMSESLKTTGQRISATAYLDEQGGVTLIEGETRLRGARSAGLPTLRIEFRPRPTSDRSLYEEARAANVERRDQTPLDDAIKWKELLAKKVYPTQVALARALNLSEDYVSRTLALANLSSRVIHAAAENPELLTHKMLTAIREYCEVLGDDSTLELILEVAKNGLGYRDVTARRKAAEKGPVKRPRSTRELLRYRGAKGELKTFEEEGRMEFTLKGLTPEVTQELTAKLLELFPKA